MPAALPPLPGSDRDLRSCTCARPQATRRRERQIVHPALADCASKPWRDSGCRCRPASANGKWRAD